MTIEEILLVSQEKKASDIHLAPGSPLMFRINGDLIPQRENWTLPFLYRVCPESVPMCSDKEVHMAWLCVYSVLRHQHLKVLEYRVPW